MYLSTTSVSNGVYTPPQFTGDTGRYKEETTTEITDKEKPSLQELKQTLAQEEDNLDALLDVFGDRMERLNKLTGSDYKIGSLVDFQA